MGEWRDLKVNPPPRESFVLVYGPGGCYVNRIDAMGNVRNRLGRIMDSATYWQPLPPPPRKADDA